MNQTMTTPLASGQGQFHSDTSKTNARPLNTVTLDDVFTMASNPPTVDKLDGWWFIPSTLLTRNFTNQGTDGVFHSLWADIDHGSPELNTVVSAMNTLGCDYLIYSSRSAKPSALKWRIIIPTAAPISGIDWPRFQAVLNNVITGHGMTPDGVNVRPAQLCILPNKGDHYQWHQNRNSGPLNPSTWLEFLPPLIIKPPVQARGTDNPQFDKLIEQVEILDDRGDGEYVIECPWAHGHSDPSKNEALLVSPNNTNGGQGGFNCLHTTEGHDAFNIGTVYNHFNLGIVRDPTTLFSPGGDMPPPERLQPVVMPPAPSATLNPEGDEAHQLMIDCATCVSLENVIALVPRIAPFKKLDPGFVAQCIERMTANSHDGSVTKKLVNDIITGQLKKMKVTRAGQIAINNAVNGHPLDYLNQQYYKIDNDGAPVVAHFGQSGELTQQLNTSTYSQFKELLIAHAPAYCEQRQDFTNAADAWLAWPGANHHHRIVFQPGQPHIIPVNGGTATNLNTYTPPVVEAVMDDTLLQPFLNHVFQYICGGDEVQYQYLMSWCADLIQRPHVKPGVGVMLAGGIGCGKSTVAKCVGKLLGPTFVKLTGKNAMKSEFNSIQRDKMLILIEEASEKESSVLRDRVDSDTVTINAKFKTEFVTQCFARFMMASNEEAPVDTSRGDRRWAMLDCLPLPWEPNTVEHNQYFDNLHDTCIDLDGFSGALMSYLTRWDISTFNVKQVPMTNKKRDMLELGKTPVDEFVDACLEDGKFYGTGVKIQSQGFILNSCAIESLQLWWRDNHINGRVPKSQQLSNVWRQRGWVKYRAPGGTQRGWQMTRAIMTPVTPL